MNKSREELLQELSTLVHPDGRKRRNDSRQKHDYPPSRKPPTQTRSDKGKKRNLYPEQTPLSIYNRVKARIYEKDRQLIAKGELPLLRGFDENGYYIVIPPSYVIKKNDYRQMVDGRIIDHTTRKVQVQKEIDLERYRFEAWSWQALSTPDIEVPWCPELMVMLDTRYGIIGEQAKKAIANRRINWFDLFCEFYHVAPSDASMWDYDTWQEMYSYVPCQLLDDDFVFSLYLRPGSPEFHPEWAYHAEKLTAQREQERLQEIERRRQQFVSHWRFSQKEDKND